ncbi:MAG TPA: AmmeMemoRadiSam system radical SAM enzyme [Methanosarcinales archaeon]|nr:AmmeMemoRadiSam system radical SAM enzyme [Methanosarcinales archaeon]
MKEAMFYEKLADNRVKCHLCNHFCVIGENKRGICSVRENRDGTLYSLVYGRLVASDVDPIEKKPLFNFLPGTRSFSIATAGCNLRCLWCQNWYISQLKSKQEIPGQDMAPEEVVDLAIRNNCKTIAYTYTEPTIFIEFALDVMKLAHNAGIKNVFVTNGYISSEALLEISPYLDAGNIDLKAFNEKTYRKMCGAGLAPVLETIRLYRELGIWLEVTTLVVSTVNDSEEELREIARFIADVGVEIPWHITRFHPQYKFLDAPSTRIEILHRAREIGIEEGLRYVYEGNIPGTGNENTYCYQCNKLLIERFGFSILLDKIENGKCYNCGAEIDGLL